MWQDNNPNIQYIDPLAHESNLNKKTSPNKKRRREFDQEKEWSRPGILLNKFKFNRIM
jgi:hypothetical protein